MQSQELVDALTPIVALGVTHATKWIGPKIPKWIIPLIAIVLGTLGNVIATAMLDGNQSIGKSVLLGLAAIAIRETGKHWVPASKPPTGTITSLLMAGLLVFATGCASWEKNSYRTLATTSTMVDATMNAWGDYVRSGMATTADEDTVRKAYKKYQQAMATARVAVEVARAAESSQSKDAASKALDGVSACTSEIIALIQRFTQKGTP